MATPKTKWVCDQCGSAVMGSRRPRLDATVRYCLTCSAKADRLVQRTAPYLEAKREQQAERAKLAAAKRKERAKAAEARPWTVEGVDMRPLIPVFWKALEPWHKGKRLPEIDTPRRYRNNPWSTGTCYRWRIALTFGTEYSDAAATLLHELAHAAAPVGANHGPEWKMIFQSAARAIYPAVDFKFHELPTYPTRQQVQAAVTRGIATVSDNHDTVSEMRENYRPVREDYRPVEA